MKNIINYDIDFWKIPLEIKKYLYIHDDLCLNIKINTEYNKEKLVEIKNNEIICEPFWNDKKILTWDKELDELTNLEETEMKKYLKNNPNFWIFVRKSVKDKLLKINNKLKSKWYYLAIKIWYRPLEVQKTLLEEALKYFQEKNIKEKLWKTIDEIYEETIEMISDPNKYVSPHVTWAAVDVILYDKFWKLIDMWCNVNHIWEEANLTTLNITNEQKNNRDILINAFLEEWFSSLSSEWWHFSYWDPYWAKFYWKKEAKYWMI